MCRENLFLETVFNGPYYPPSSVQLACLVPLLTTFFSKLLRQGKEALLSLYREENVVCPNRKRCFDDRVSWDFSKNFLKNLRVYVTVTIVIFALVQDTVTRCRRFQEIVSDF